MPDAPRLSAPHRGVLLGWCALFAVACGGAARSGPAGSLSASEVGQYARVLAAADARQPDSAAVLAAIRSSSAPLRRAGALAAGQIRIRPLTPALRDLLHDAETSVAARAAFALALLKDTASIPALDSALHGPDPVAVESAFALGDIGGRARDAILAALATVRPRVRGELLLAAAKLRPVPAREIAAFLRDADPCVRWASAYALSRSRAVAGVGPLIAAASDERIASQERVATREGYECSGAETRASIARALIEQSAGDSLTGRALRLLHRYAEDTAPHVRINALRSLATFADSAVTRLIAATADGDANVRIAAAQSLSGKRLAAEVWTAVWRADSGLMYRRSLLESATRADAVLPAHHEWRHASDWRMRAALADAAALAPRAARGIDLATPLLSDPDPRVRQSAVAAVAAFLDSARAGDARRARVLAALRDPDFFVRATALLALGDSARASEVPAVLSSYALAAGDSGNDARIASIRYVARAWGRDSAAFAPGVRSAVRALEPPDDPLVRAEAQHVPLFSTWPGTAGSPRRTSWYATVVRDIVAPAVAGRPRIATIRTDRGPITLRLLGEDAPLTVENFIRLAGAGYYRNVRFHRVVPNFVAQDGDPRGDGNGGPGYAIRDELNTRRYQRGAVGMALSGPDTGGSQYFLTLSPQPHLDARYTIFAIVIGGHDVMDRLIQGDLIHDIAIAK